MGQGVGRGAAGPRERRRTARPGVAAAAVAAGAVPFVLLVLLVRSEAAWLLAVDRGAASALPAYVRAQPALRDALIAVQEVTQPWLLNAVAVAVAAVLLVRGQRRVATWLAVTVLTGWFLGFVLKLVVERARPTLPDPVELAPGWSFPSGHALGSFVFATTMALLLGREASRRTRTALWAGAALLVVAVGVDRVALGVHYVSDVAAGWLVGAVLVTATTMAMERADPGAGPDEDVSARRSRLPSAG